MKKKIWPVLIAVAVLVIGMSLSALWRNSMDHRPQAYTGQWLDEEKSGWVISGTVWDYVVITEVYSNCFFGESVCYDRTVKFNGVLTKKLGVGDRVWVVIQNWHWESGSRKNEGDVLFVDTTPQSWQMFYSFIRVVFR